MRNAYFGILCAAVAANLQVVGVQAGDVTDWLAIKGDIRNRFEIIDEDGKPSRERNRLRARLALSGKASDELDVHLRLISGGGDPVSANQTFGDGFATTDFGLDHAYVNYHPAFAEGFELLIGKQKQTWVVIKDLIWDSDLSPEGAVLNWEMEDNQVDLTLHGGFYSVQERSTEDDTYLFAAQTSATFKPTEDTSFMGGASLFAYTSMEGFPTVFDAEDSFGNDVIELTDPETGDVTELIYPTEFTEVEVFGKAGFDVGLPATVYGDYVVNTDADDEDTGYMVGASLGKTKDPGSWALDYNYRDLQANAVVGAFTDSDSGGGGTDVEGHKVQAKYQLAKNWQFAVSWFFNKINNGDTEYTRGQIDLVAKF